MRTPFLFVLVLAACGDGEPDGPEEPAPDLQCGSLEDGELELSGGTNNGIFDPSLEAAVDGVFWMSLSAVERSPEGYDRVRTHLAHSVDGATWCDAGPANANTPSGPGVLNHEVSSLVHDPGAPAAEAWKLYWHRYVLEGTTRRFELGTVVMRSAATPEGLLAGSEVALIIDAATPLADCLVYTEPGALAIDGRLLLALQCATGSEQRIVILELDRSSGHYVYRGTPLRGDDLKPINASINGVAAPSLVARGGAITLVVSPVVEPLYAGCLAYGLSLSTYAVGPPLHGQSGPPGELVGACDFEPTLDGLGLVVSQTTLASQPVFHIKTPGVVW